MRPLRTTKRILHYSLTALLSLALFSAPDAFAKSDSKGDKCHGHDKCKEHDKCRQHDRGHDKCKPKVDPCKDHDRCKEHDKCRQHDKGHNKCKPKVDPCKDHDRCKEHDKCRQHDKGHNKCKPKVDPCKDHDRCKEHDKCRQHDKGHNKCKPKVDPCKDHDRCKEHDKCRQHDKGHAKCKPKPDTCRDRCVDHNKCRKHDRGHEHCRSQLEVVLYGGQAIVTHLTNLHTGPQEVLIGDTGLLPTSGGTLEAHVDGTNLLDALLIDLAQATTIGQGNQSVSEVSIEEFTIHILATNGTVHTVTFESMQVSASAECTANGAVVSGSVTITGLKVDDQVITVTGEANQRINYDGGFILVNARNTRVEGNSGAITVAGLYIHNDGCMEGPIGLAYADVVCEMAPAPTDCLKITGSGAIYGTPSGDKGVFCLSAGKRGDKVWGSLQYLDYDTSTWVKSICVKSITRVDNCTYVIEYKVKIDGAEGTARVEVSDYSKSGKNDLFKIELSSGYEAADTICRGNIKVKKCAKHCRKKCDGGNGHGGDDDDDDDEDDDDDDDGGHDDDDDGGHGKGHGHDDDDD